MQQSPCHISPTPLQHSCCTSSPVSPSCDIVERTAANGLTSIINLLHPIPLLGGYVPSPPPVRTTPQISKITLFLMQRSDRIIDTVGGERGMEWGFSSYYCRFA